MKILLRYLRKGTRKILPQPAKQLARRGLGLMGACKARARLTVGLQPLSERWGWDRGFPIHRYYLEQFLHEYSSDIRGHCLEFQDDAYTTRFGGAAVSELDLLHIDDSNPKATIVADLTKPNKIPSNLFDCIVCSHVFHVILELDKAEFSSRLSRMSVCTAHANMKSGASLPKVFTEC